MFVFYKYPLGSTIIDGKRIYGYLEKYDATYIPYNVWICNRQNLISMPYTKAGLEKVFPGKQFPDLSFNLDDIKKMSWENMCILCKAFGLTTGRKNKLRRKQLVEFMKENC